ncbi:hypothetical protein ABRP83_13425 [Pectobacterium brasiliense]|uniref:hypothetical protein n=1 Tax=Pectobacterium brasiliense TaxID=180957 RepID=UPI0032EF34A0
MSSTKDYILEVEEKNRDSWIADHYPNAEVESDEWESAAQNYRWFQDWMEAAAEQQYFEASLACIPDRLAEAKGELYALEQLLRHKQPEIVLRMAFVHAITVMDSFLMYSARALLHHPSHLARFMQHAGGFVRNKRAWQALHNAKWIEQEPDVDTPAEVYIRRAQALVGEMTFQSHKFIRGYFTTLLATPVAWPLDEIAGLVRTRNDLVHRNGVSVSHEPVHIWPDRVQEAIRQVTVLIVAAATTLLQEDAQYTPDNAAF